MDSVSLVKSPVLRVCVVLSALIFSGCVTIPPAPPVSMPRGIYHTVGSGQTLYRISKAYCVDIKEIMRLNNISNPDQIGVGDRLFIPGANIPLYVEPYKPPDLAPVERLVGEKKYSVRWRYITLHHSATSEGSAEAFDRNHRNRKMGGLFYHFVIGNGRGSGDGQIEVGWRWRKQAEVERPNEIEICLVGDFNRQEISSAQFQALAKLLYVLTQQYSIPLCNIRRHKDVTHKITECPGDNFPFHKLLAELRKDG